MQERKNIPQFMNDIKPLSDEEIKERYANYKSFPSPEYAELFINSLLATIKSRDEELAKSSNGFYGKLAANASNEVVVLKEQLRLATERAEKAEQIVINQDNDLIGESVIKNQLTADNQRLREALELGKKALNICYADSGCIVVDVLEQKYGLEFVANAVRNIRKWSEKFKDLEQILNSTHPTNHLTDKEQVKKEKSPEQLAQEIPLYEESRWRLPL